MRNIESSILTPKITKVPERMLKINVVGLDSDDQKDPYIETMQSMSKTETNWIGKYTTPALKEMQAEDLDLTFVLQ